MREIFHCRSRHQIHLPHWREGRIDKLEEKINIRLDRIESEVKLVHSETLALRADFAEFRERSKEPA